MKSKTRPKMQSTIFPEVKASDEFKVWVHSDVVKIKPNICMEKNVCQICDRGNKYGIPLHFLLHLANGDIKTVCYACGKSVAKKIGLKLPSTESDIEAREAEFDFKLIRRAEQKKEEKNGTI